MKKTRIRWSDEERALVTQKMAQMLNEGHSLQMNPLLKAAQTVLPENRHRVAFTAEEVRKFNMRAHGDAAALLAKQEPKPEPQKPASPSPLEQLQQLRQVNRPSAPRGDMKIDYMINQLFEALVERVAARVVHKLKETQPKAPVYSVEPPKQSQGEWVPPFDPAEAKANLRERTSVTGATGECKPGVLVIGTLSHYAAKVAESHPNLDIVCVEAREGERRPYILRAHTILMTKFITHGVQYKYRKATNLKFCNGGMTELHDMLKKIEEQK